MGNSDWSVPLNNHERQKTSRVLEQLKARFSSPRAALERAVGAHYSELDFALFWANLHVAKPTAGYDLFAHNYLQEAFKNDHLIERAPSLIQGLGQAGIVAHCLSANGRRYGKLLSTVDSVICSHVEAQATTIKSKIGRLRLHEYDVVTGLSGLTAYLLRRGPEHQEASLRVAIETLTEVTLALPDLGGFKTPNALLTGSLRDGGLYPGGLINTGLAHGVPGVLSALSLAYRLGVKSDATADAIKIISDFLIRHATPDFYGTNWPAAVPLNETGDPAYPASGPCRGGWCYGSPGVSRALWLAGLAVDEAYCRHAIDAVKAFVARPLATLGVNSCNLCHGAAGLLQILLRFHNETGLFLQELKNLHQHVVNSFDSKAIVGYRDTVGDGQSTDDTSFLSGATGIGLCLSSCLSNVDPSWDRLLLIS
jgi:lantibiotic biosynthesis protein